MISSTGKQIIDKAIVQLNDLKGIRWTRTELLGWVSDAQQQIVLMAPNACSITRVVPLFIGTRQSLPVAGWLLLDVYRNMSGDIESLKAPGRAVRIISRDLLDRFNPDWHTDKSVKVVVNYIYDTQDPSTFWVYPPNSGEGQLQINYSKTPDDLETEEQSVEVQPVYEMAMVDYVLYRACSKDAEYAPGLALAQGYLATFTAGVTGKSSTEAANTPNLSMGERGAGLPGANS
jgi:hypothetical protein